jgi:hypothetical protein
MEDLSYNTIIINAFRCSKISKVEREHIVNIVSKLGKGKIFKYAEERKIIPFIANLMLDLNIDAAFWINHANYYKKRNSYLLAVLSKIFASLKKKGVKKIFVYENFGALLASGNDISLFASGDIDIFADVSEKEKIKEAFLENGFISKPKSHRKELLSSEYYNSHLEYAFTLNVMWQPLLREKLPFEMDINNSIDWDNLSFFKDTNISLPPKNALMYLCALHISVHNYSRSPDIRLYIDINNVASLEPDYIKVMEYATKDNKEVRVATALSISKELLECNIPDVVFDLPRRQVTRIKRILKMVCDDKNRILKYEPNALQMLQIEFLSDNKNLISGLFGMIFPKKDWIRKFYLKGRDNLLVGYFKYIKNLF